MDRLKKYRNLWASYRLILAGMVFFVIVFFLTVNWGKPVSGLAIPEDDVRFYARNDIKFYSPCKPGEEDSDSLANGDSYKINPNTPPGSANNEGTGGFWYLEGRWSSYPKTTIYKNNIGIVPKKTKIDKDFFDMPYIYAENYDINYNVYPVKMTPNGKSSTRKYYWIVLPNEAYTVHMGDKYVAYFEKRKEPVYFITYDVWSCEHHYLRGMHYCDWARKDPDDVNGGLANNSLGHFSERGWDANNQAGDALGRLTCLHRITTEGKTLANESAKCKGGDSSVADDDDDEEDDEDESDDSGSSESEKKDDDKEKDDDNDENDDSSEVKLHQPKNAWLDKAGLDGFKVIRALNSQAGSFHVDTSAMELGTDKYTSYAKAAGNGAGLPGFIILHWTAVNGYDGAGSGADYPWTAFGDGKEVYYPPHFAIDVVNKKIWQYFPLSSPSAAVKAGTEIWDQYGVQIEVVGCNSDSCGGRTDAKYNVYKFTDEQYEYLAKLLIAISKETGIPLTSNLKWDENAPKLSAAETKKYIGVLGHEHLPDQDGKIDPGKLWDYLKPALEKLGYEYDSEGGDDEDGDVICSGEGDEDGEGCGGAKIAKVAQELAWPDANHYGQIKPEFAAAAKTVGLAGYATSMWDAQDCGKFTAVAVRKAVDPDYPACCTWVIEEYLANSSKWKEIPNTGSESNMEPGDVMIGNLGSHGYGSKAAPSGGEGADGHAQIYIGNGRLASASWKRRTGDTSVPLYFSSSKYTFRIFRFIGEDCSNDEDDDDDDDEEGSGALKDDIKKLEKSGAKVGVALSATGNKKAGKVQTYGSYKGARAWSTIKVPLAIAAIQEDVSTGKVTDPYGGTCTHTLSSAVSAAIKKSDNCAAWWLWQALGGDSSSAADKVTKVIKAGGDTSTSVTSKGDGHSLTSGMTTWTLKNQAIFAANMESITKSSDVLTAMKSHNAEDGSHGLSGSYTSMVKGGWGDGATRQFGIIKVKKDKCTAVAIGTNQGSNFSMLDKIAKVLLNHKKDLPTGSCPKGL